MGRKKIDITNQKFGYLTAIKDTGKTDKSGKPIWLFKCDCGNIVEKPKYAVSSGNTKSCGRGCKFAHEQN